MLNKKRRAIALIMLLVLTVSSVGIQQKSGAKTVEGVTSDGFAYVYNTESVNVSVTGYEGTQTEAVIPSIINGKRVTSVSICYHVTLRKLTIPSSVTSIQRNGYESNEDSFNLFSHCTALEEIVVDKDNESYSSEGGLLMSKDKTLLYCVAPGVKGSVTIPATVRWIDDRTFASCDLIDSIQVQPGSKYLEGYEGVLYTQEKKRLIAYPKAKTATHFVIPNETEIIGTYSVAENKYLQQVLFGKRVTKVEDYAFYKNSSLEEVVTTEGLRTIGASAFALCYKMTKVNFINGLKDIGANAFTGASLTKVDIPISVLRVGFSSITLHDNMTMIFRNIPTSGSNSDCYEGKGKNIKVYTYKSAKDYETFKKEGFKVYKLPGDGIIKKAKLKKVKMAKKTVKGTGKPSTSWYKKKAKKLYISSPDQLAGMQKLMSKKISFRKQTIILKKNIDMSKYKNWTPIGYGQYVDFEGIFDGNNKKIYHLNIG